MSNNLPASAQASRDVYVERAERFGREWATLDAKWNQIGNLRLFVFLLSVAGLTTAQNSTDRKLRGEPPNPKNDTPANLLSP